jgi:hypothetical protein
VATGEPCFMPTDGADARLNDRHGARLDAKHGASRRAARPDARPKSPRTLLSSTAFPATAPRRMWTLFVPSAGHLPPIRQASVALTDAHVAVLSSSLTPSRAASRLPPSGRPASAFWPGVPFPLCRAWPRPAVRDRALRRDSGDDTLVSAAPPVRAWLRRMLPGACLQVIV